MANETIYGCVDWSDGSIVFTQGCNNYTGCIIWDGARAGQVAVIIDTLDCNDTYYGCVNWSTGKFQLVIPDNCDSHPPGVMCATLSDIVLCSGTISGCSDCDPFTTSGWGDPNGSITFTHSGAPTGWYPDVIVGDWKYRLYNNGGGCNYYFWVCGKEQYSHPEWGQVCFNARPVYENIAKGSSYYVGNCGTGDCNTDCDYEQGCKVGYGGTVLLECGSC